MKGLAARLVQNKKELEQTFKIRDIVFGKEQKIPRALDYDGLDKYAKHIILLYKNKSIGCARIRFIKNNAKLERMAILKQYRSKGFGEALLNYLVNYCAKSGVKEIYLHAQHYAKLFYERRGFKIRGRPFTEVGVKHIEMYLKLLR